MSAPKKSAKRKDDSIFFIIGDMFFKRATVNQGFGLAIVFIAIWALASIFLIHRVFLRVEFDPHRPIIVTGGDDAPGLTGTVRLVCMSDTYGFHKDLVVPEGDIFIHTGDFNRWNSSEVIEYEKELKAFNDFLGELPHKHKLVVPGDMDIPVDLMKDEDDAKQRLESILSNAVVLWKKTVEIYGLRFYGAPWQTHFPENAFYVHVSGTLKIWQDIPKNVDVVLSHAPPILKGISHPYPVATATAHIDAGDFGLSRILGDRAPRLAVFGHVIPKYGDPQHTVEPGRSSKPGAKPITFINAAMGFAGSSSLHHHHPHVVDIILPEAMHLYE